MKIHKKFLLIVVISTIIGAYLRFWNLGTPPFWIDEILFIHFSSISIYSNSENNFMQA